MGILNNKQMIINKYKIIEHQQILIDTLIREKEDKNIEISKLRCILFDLHCMTGEEGNFDEIKSVINDFIRTKNK